MILGDGQIGINFDSFAQSGALVRSITGSIQRKGQLVGEKGIPRSCRDSLAIELHRFLDITLGKLLLCLGSFARGQSAVGPILQFLPVDFELFLGLLGFSEVA